MTLLRLNLNILKKLKRDNIIFFESIFIPNSLENTINILYIDDDFKFYFTKLILDNVQYEIFSNSRDKEGILLKSIELCKTFEKQPIKDNILLSEFIQKNGLVEKIRDLKLNKIIN